jgi:ribonuclease BN (tRNA processing enzyme)
MRELIILGTASQVPTRTRNHNGYFLRWDRDGLLFDPGEGTQRQMTLAGVAATDLTRLCVSHFPAEHMATTRHDASDQQPRSRYGEHIFRPVPVHSGSLRCLI